MCKVTPVSKYLETLKNSCQIHFLYCIREWLMVDCWPFVTSPNLPRQGIDWLGQIFFKPITTVSLKIVARGINGRIRCMYTACWLINDPVAVHA